jgi:hypothetical protein
MILVCPCGARLNAPGAVPGRAGKCPVCGAALKVTEAPPAAGPELPQPRSEDTPDESSVVPGVFQAPPARKPRRRKRSLADRIDTWHGFVSRPDRAEQTILASLAYPFWDVTGLVFIVGFSVLWWAFLLVPFSLFVDGLAPTGITMMFVTPLLFAPLLVLGFNLLYLRDVLVTSAAGELRHPRWPSGDPGEVIRGILRWFWALLIGGIIGLFPAVWYWIRCGSLDLLDYFVLIDLILPGVAYGQMALVGTMLFDDPLAANPITVGLALWRVGLGSLRSALVVSVAIGLAGVLAAAIMKIPIPALALFGLWLLLAFVLYEALVVIRVLGLEYRRNARKIGWFRDGSRRRR